MPTIKDIAERAGVSHGTVSNVLNKRGNVSVEKIQLVEQAAKELGYSMNAQAKELRAGSSKRVCVVIPNSNVKRYRDFCDGMMLAIKDSEYELSIHYTNDNHYEEERELSKIVMLNPLAIILISSLQKHNDIFNGEIPVYYLERKIKNMPGNAIYIGFDYYTAGQALAKRCLEDGKRRIAIYCENASYSNDHEFLAGVKDVLEECDCSFGLFQSLSMMKLNSAFELANSEIAYDALITDNEERSDLYHTIGSFIQRDDQPAVYSITSKSLAFDDCIVRYELNYKHCGKRLIQYILKSMDHKAQPFEPLLNDGFREAAIYEQQKDQRLNFLTLNSPTTEALRYLLPDFKRKTGIDVNIVEVTYDELNKVLMRTMETKSPYDLIRMDMVWLDQYAENIYKPIDLKAPPYCKIVSNFSKVLKDEYFQINGKAYGLPMDPSVQILYYRKDLFEDALIRRAFYEEFKRQLNIPATFKEYDEICEFFTKSYHSTSATLYGTTMTYGAAAVASCDFLPRFREKISLQNALHTKKDMKGILQETLSEYKRAQTFTDKKMYQWWNQSIKVFSEGRSAMNIVFSNHAARMVLHHSDIAGKVGFAMVPGGKPLLGGGVIGISKDTQADKACEVFFDWLYSENISTAITALGGYVNNRNLIHNEDILQIYPWIEGMEQAFSLGTRRYQETPLLEVKEVQFEERLGEAIRSYMLDLQSLEDCMKEVTKDLIRKK